MAYRWPADTDFSLWELDVLDRNCPACGRMMHICDHRYRRVHTLDGPVQLICKLNPDFSPGEWNRAALRVIGGIATTIYGTGPRQPDDHRV